MDISPCRYCGNTPKPELTENGYRVHWRCTKSEYPLKVVGAKYFTDERMAIKDWNATNDLSGPDIVEPVISEL